MIVCVVSSIREYENDERYFGVDGVFTDPIQAIAYLKKDISERIEEEGVEDDDPIFLMEPLDDDIDSFMSEAIGILTAELCIWQHRYSWFVERMSVTDDLKEN